MEPFFWREDQKGKGKRPFLLASSVLAVSFNAERRAKTTLEDSLLGAWGVVFLAVWITRGVWVVMATVLSAWILTSPPSPPKARCLYVLRVMAVIVMLRLC